MSNEKLVRKILRTLPKIFAHKTEPHVDNNRVDNSEDKDEMTKKELLENYTLLYTKWTELTVIYTKAGTEKGKLKKENEKLAKMVLDRDEEINNLNAQLKSLNKGLKMMNSSTNIFDEILVTGKDVGDSTDIGYERGKFNNQKGEVKFVPAGGNQQSTTIGATRSYRKRTNRIWYCHYCAKKGHIASYCYNLYRPKKSKYPSHKTL
ncbi:hypothetical protein LIER_16617 [Lithospermum erythrorhizon]|uniref:CCHC-type domain-containing protein n=1 Tax=Lithospermum erythrorhizon TaxID=34254 RepID=A0AAV3Q7C7_LITER